MTIQEPLPFWWMETNPRWVHTLSRRAVATYITESTLAMAKSCITRASAVVCVDDRWKRFLSDVSLAASVSG